MWTTNTYNKDEQKYEQNTWTRNMNTKHKRSIASNLVPKICFMKRGLEIVFYKTSLAKQIVATKFYETSSGNHFLHNVCNREEGRGGR